MLYDGDMVELKNLKLKISITRGDYPPSEADQQQSDTEHKNIFCDNIVMIAIANDDSDGISAAVLGYDGEVEPLENPHHPEASDLDTVMTSWAAMTHILSRDMRLPYGIRRVLGRSCDLVGQIHSGDDELNDDSEEGVYREH